MRKNIFFLLVALLLTAAGISRAQQMDRDSVVMPYPEIGWEKFDSLIVYPEIARRAGIEGVFTFTINIDSLGAVSSIESTVISYTENKITGIEAPGFILEMIPKVKWVPAVKNGKAVNYKLYLPVILYLDDVDKTRAHYIFKEAKTYPIQKIPHRCGEPRN